LVEVTLSGADRTHWRIMGIFGISREWDAVLAVDIPGKVIEWKSLGRGQDERELRIQFAPAPAGQGSETTLIFRYDPPGGTGLGTLSKLFALAPDLMLGKVLYRFKAFAETGEIPTLRFNAAHRKGADQPGEQR
jgi:uncharacterized membrane protein